MGGRVVSAVVLLSVFQLGWEKIHGSWDSVGENPTKSVPLLNFSSSQTTGSRWKLIKEQKEGACKHFCGF